MVLEAVLRLWHFRPLLAAVGKRLMRGGRWRQRMAVVPTASVHFHGEWPAPDVVDAFTAAATSVEGKRIKTINLSRNDKSKIDENRAFGKLNRETISVHRRLENLCAAIDSSGRTDCTSRALLDSLGVSICGPTRIHFQFQST